MMQIAYNISTPTPIITLCIPSGAISTAQKSIAVQRSLYRLKGCLGDVYRDGSDICVQFDGLQTTEETVHRIAQRMLAREQSGNVELAIATHWELTIAFIVDIDGRSRGAISTKLCSLLSDHTTMRWQGSREVRVATPVEPGRNFRQEITAASFTS